VAATNPDAIAPPPCPPNPGWCWLHRMQHLQTQHRIVQHTHFASPCAVPARPAALRRSSRPWPRRPAASSLGTRSQPPGPASWRCPASARSLSSALLEAPSATALNIMDRRPPPCACSPLLAGRGACRTRRPTRGRMHNATLSPQHAPGRLRRACVNASCTNVTLGRNATEWAGFPWNEQPKIKARGGGPRRAALHCTALRGTGTGVARQQGQRAPALRHVF
jgi:hypothetical protein